MDQFIANFFVGKAIGGGVANDVSQLAIPADPFRKWVGIYNLDADNILYIALDMPAVAGRGIPLFPRDGYEQKFSDITVGAIYIIADAGLIGRFCWQTGR